MLAYMHAQGREGCYGTCLCVHSKDTPAYLTPASYAPDIIPSSVEASFKSPGVILQVQHMPCMFPRESCWLLVPASHAGELGVKPKVHYPYTCTLDRETEI